MGRETKILLALLATLGGVFLGVLSMKLLVPRPPVGAGPDVHFDATAAAPIELVEPPSLSSAAPAAAAPMEAPSRTAADEEDLATPPRVAEGSPIADAGDLPSPPPPDPPPRSLAAPPSTQPAAVPFHDGRFASPSTPEGLAAAPPRRDPFVKQATLQEPIPDPVMPAEPRPATTAAYVTNPGDSWWDLAARAYGDGRLYRALFAWNRVLDPRVSLTPGTRLEIPSRERLEAAWPKLMPPE